MTTPVVTREPYDPPVAVEAGRPVERWIVTSEDDERVRQLLIGVVVALVAIVVTLIVLVIAVVHLTRQVEREGTAIRTALAPVGLATAAPTALVPAVPVATTPATVVPVAPVTTATPTIPGVTTPTTPTPPVTSTPTPSTPSTSTPAATPPASSTPSPTPTPSPAPSGGGSPNTAQNPGDAAGGTKSDDPNTAPKGDAQVKVTDQGFDPDLVNIKVGQSVTWTFVGPGNHAVFNEGFKSGPPQASGAFNHVFDKKGTYAVSDPGNPAAFASVVVK